ncbi:MAG: MaoC family dehydratase N-terminal domain-containing protein [Acidobacteriota bacterium]|nr:MaoC family dehydratase N-terminal domain-containing protein [Acidobacteriota bacterium]
MHFFEDFEVGAVFESRGRTVTETDIVNFAGLSGDFVELHTNEVYARHSPFGRRIAHGALIFSISTGLMTQMNFLNETVLAFYGLDHLRFTRPVFIGDTVRVHKKVASKQEKSEDRGIVTFETSVLNQNAEPVIVYTDKILMRRRAIA